MEEIDLKDILSLFWKNKLQIILIILLFIAIGVFYTLYCIIPEYSSSTSLVLSSSNSSKTQMNAITATDITVNSKLVSTYSELIKSNKVVRKVIENLGISIEEEELKKNISVNSVKNTELIKITVTNEKPQVATKIANEIAKVFIDKVKDIYNIENVQIVDEAEVEYTPSNIHHKKTVVIFAGIGIIIAIMYVLLKNMLDNTVKTPEDIEGEYNIPVVAQIPFCDNNIQKSKGKRGKRK